MILIDGADIKDISDFIKTRFPNAVKQARSIAVNDTARGALKFLAKKMTEEVKFPAGYLDEPNRFFISVYATPESPTAVIQARTRPTLLYRFAVGAPTPTSTSKRGAGGVTVEVQPGHLVNLKGGFVLKLKSGAFAIAVKNRPGQVPQIKKHTFNARQLANNFYILYGPSVDQVFRNTATKYAEDIRTMLDDEFKRQLLVQVQR